MAGELLILAVALAAIVYFQYRLSVTSLERTARLQDAITKQGKASHRDVGRMVAEAQHSLDAAHNALLDAKQQHDNVTAQINDPRMQRILGRVQRGEVE